MYPVLKLVSVLSASYPLLITYGGVCPSLLSQVPFVADSLLHKHHRSLCSLPSVYNPCSTLQVLDSADGVDLVL